MHKLAGFSDPTHHSFLLKVVLKGAKCFHTLKPTTKREPITVQLLGKLLSQIWHITKKDWHMLVAAFTLTFFGLLRISEFSVSSIKEFNPRIQATIKKQFAFVKESLHLLPLSIQNRPIWPWTGHTHPVNNWKAMPIYSHSNLLERT